MVMAGAKEIDVTKPFGGLQVISTHSVPRLELAAGASAHRGVGSRSISGLLTASLPGTLAPWNPGWARH